MQTITLTGDLPNITNPLTIDGFTQPGASANTLAVGNNAQMRIVINANNNGNGLVTDSGKFTIRGLVINNYSGVGIYVSPADNIVVEGCFIGTNADGTASGGTSQQNGVLFTDGVSNSVIGGTTAASRNVISGNTGGGLILSGSGGLGGTPNATVLNNYIGVAADGITPLPNTAFSGVPGSGNGITISGSNNQIGDGTAAGANVIANNGGAGIFVDNNGSANRFSGNSIYNNAELGIDLIDGSNTGGVTTNDFQDADAGANNLQNFPVLTSVSSVNGNTRVQGTLNSTPNRTFRLEFYNNAAADPTGYGEGETFIGTINAATDNNGDAAFDQTFAFTSATNSYISATATDTTENSTSEFSLNMQILAPTAADVSIAGRVLTRGGRGIRNAIVTLTLADGTYLTTQTGTFGYYHFDNIEAGQTVLVSVSAKRFSFDPNAQIINVNENLANINFQAVDINRLK